MEMLLDGYILHVAILGGECNFVNTGQKEDFHFEVVLPPNTHTMNNAFMF